MIAKYSEKQFSVYDLKNWQDLIKAKYCAYITMSIFISCLELMKSVGVISESAKVQILVSLLVGFFTYLIVKTDT